MGIERDVRHIKAVVDLSLFQTFMKLLAARAGQLLNLSEIAKEVGIESNDQLEKSPFLGAIFENMVILEFVKHLDYSLSPNKCYFYRTQAGAEVDLILAGTKPEKGYEIKFSMRLNSHMTSGLSRLEKDAPEVGLNLLSLAKYFPGIPHHSAIQCLHWYEAIQQEFGIDTDRA